jgi:N-acyl-D-amino-acid deacylase
MNKQTENIQKHQKIKLLFHLLIIEKLKRDACAQSIKDRQFTTLDKMVEEFDILIENADIIDGANKKFKGSIGVKGERVSAIGRISGDAEQTIEAEGLIAMPGFIDTHSHADWTLPWYPNCESAVMQGCTTVVAGMCGGSPGPLNEFLSPPGVIHDEIYSRSPYLYHLPELLKLDTVNEILKKKYGWAISWRTMGEYFNFVEKKGISVNYAPFVGHGAIRYTVMGEDYKRESSNAEIEQMKELIHGAMEEGCLGLTTGLDYDPDVFASRSEIDECVAVIKEYDGIYHPHWRRTGRRRDVKMGTRLEEPIKGIVEVIETARKTGVRLHIAHLAPGYHTVPPMSPTIGEVIGRETLTPIDEAIKEGLNVSFDLIPWPCWEPFPYLCSQHFAQWLRLLNSREKLAEWLKVDEFRRKAWEEIETGKLYQRTVINPCLNPHWGENFKIVEHRNKEYEGKTLAQVADMLKKDPWNTLCDLIVEDPDSRGAHSDYRGIEEQMKVFMKHPMCATGLDVSIMDDKWEHKVPPYGIPLPDTYAGYPKFLIRYVRDSNFLTLEEAVQKCSTLPAKIYNLKDRGTIRAGGYADITLVDLPNIEIVGAPELSHNYPKGIPYVIVNGKIVVKEGKHTGERPGRILKRK